MSIVAEGDFSTIAHSLFLFFGHKILKFGFKLPYVYVFNIFFHANSTLAAKIWSKRRFCKPNRRYMASEHLTQINIIY